MQTTCAAARSLTSIHAPFPRDHTRLLTPRSPGHHRHSLGQLPVKWGSPGLTSHSIVAVSSFGGAPVSTPVASWVRGGIALGNGLAGSRSSVAGTGRDSSPSSIPAQLCWCSGSCTGASGATAKGPPGQLLAPAATGATLFGNISTTGDGCTSHTANRQTAVRLTTVLQAPGISNCFPQGVSQFSSAAGGSSGTHKLQRQNPMPRCHKYSGNVLLG